MIGYKIVNSELGFKIYREKDGHKMYYDVKGQRNENETHARLFFHRADAESALTILRIKGRKETEEISDTPEEGVEKQSWSEL